MKIGYISGIGNVRRENQDRFLVLQQKDMMGEFVFLCMVADGMGGTGKGSFASNFVQEKLQNWWSKVLPQLLLQENVYEYVSQSLNHLFNFCNKEIVKQAKEGGISTGTTISLVFGYKDKVIIKHIGDTRIYLCREKIWIQLTRDHSWQQKEFEDGKNPKEDKEYSKKKNALTNALGVKENFYTDSKMLQLKEKDIYLLCSDGFYEYINPYTKLQDVNEPQQILFIKEKELLQTPAKDNYTAVLFMMEQEEVIEVTEVENTLFP